MEIRLILALLRRWVWLLVLGAVIGAIIGYAFTRTQQPEYESSTRIMVIRAPESYSTDTYLSYLGDQQLAKTYAELLLTRPVLDATSERLGYAVNVGQIRVDQPQNSQIVSIIVRDADRQRTSAIADTLVDVFIAYNEDLQVGRFAASEETLSAQLAQIEQQISDAEAEINLLSDSNQESRQEEIGVTLTAVDEQIRTLQQELAQLATPESTLDTDIELIEKQLELSRLEAVYTVYQQDYVEAIGTGDEVQQTSAEQELNRLEGEIIDLRTAVLQLSAPADNSESEALRIDAESELEKLRTSRELYLQALVNSSLGISDDLSRTEQLRANQLQTQLTLYQQIYSNLLNSFESVRLARLQNTPNVVQVEEPQLGRPLGQQPLTLLGAVVGFLFAAGIAFVIEYLDDTLKSPEDVSRILNAPVIGYVSDTAEVSEGGAGNFIAAQPRSPVAEAFRGLRTNLEYAQVDKPLRTLLITSPSPAEGKTTIASGLATTVAQSGRRVLVLDADMRRPRIHKEFGVSNAMGLSDLFRGNGTLDEVVQSGSIPNLEIVTSGNLPPNPTELLASGRMAEILTECLQRADLVILDSPPFVVTDPFVLGSRVDGVLLAVRPGKTQAANARAAMEQLKRANAHVLGVVINRIPKPGVGYYSGYRYYSSYYYYRSDYYTTENAQYNDPKPGKGNGVTRIFGRKHKRKPQHAETTD